MKAININKEFKKVNNYWQPHQIAKIDDMQVVLTKVKREITSWFEHNNEDKFIQVIQGTLEIKFRESKVVIKQGEIITIPKGTEYSLKADEETHVLVFEKFEPKH